MPRVLRVVRPDLRTRLSELKRAKAGDVSRQISVVDSALPNGRCEIERLGIHSKIRERGTHPAHAFVRHDAARTKRIGFCGERLKSIAVRRGVA